MHWTAADRIDHEALRRLGVILLTLAALAESVARRSAPFRAILLWLLARAEVRARYFASRTAVGTALSSARAVSPVCMSGGSGEATRLARAFRALAEVFFALSRQAQWRMARRHSPDRPLDNYRNLLGLRQWPCTRQRWCADTS
jgi:hypothetical protein